MGRDPVRVHDDAQGRTVPRVPGDVGEKAITRSYLICSVPRSGSTLLCRRLRRTGLAGAPYEVFQQGPAETHQALWGVSTFADYFDAFRRRTVSPNGVLGAKVLWGQLEHAPRRLREEAGFPGNRDDEVLAAAFPHVRYIFLRRDDKVRQGLSWWRAEVTQKWDVRRDSPIPAAPEYDFTAIDTFVQRAHAYEALWQRWFASHGISPYEVTYESFLQHPERTLRGILHSLDIDIPLEFAFRRDRFTWRRHNRRQADDATEALESRYRADLASLGDDRTA
jgi:LPS sulfotransferase NodH